MVLIASPGVVVALVGVDAERDTRSHRRADPAHHLDVALRLDADLDLDGADAFGRDLGGLALPVLDRHQADRVRDRNRLAHRPAQEIAHRNTAYPAGEIVGGDVHRGLGVRVALDGRVHALVEQAQIADRYADRRRAEIALDHKPDRCGTLAEIAAVFAAPVLERRRLAPADPAGIVGQPHQRVTPDAFGQPGPLVLAAGRQ